MTKKDFELIARVVLSATGSDRQIVHRQDLAEWFAAELEKTNPRFDRERFLEACEVQEAN